MTQNTLSDKIKREETSFVEQGAAIEHERWAKWQRYLHAKCFTSEDGDLIIPKELVERWERQIATPYAELSETEKESDRREVRTYLPLLHKYVYSIAEKTVEAVRVEKEANLGYYGYKTSEQYGKVLGRNETVHELETKASRWLGKEEV